MRDVFVARLLALAQEDRRIMLMTGDLGFGVLTEFANSLPEQFLNVGVAEQNMTGVATGMALEVHVVFTYSIGNFPTLRCLEQLRNDAAYHHANVKVVAVGGGFSYGALGMSHHATEDLAILRAIPGITVVAPGCDWESAEATTALVSQLGTCYLRLDKTTAGDTSRPAEVFRLGKGRVLREGDCLAVIACGGILREVLAAADALAEAGSSVTVVSMPTLNPFDRELVHELAREHEVICTVEEHRVVGGLGSATAECLADGPEHRTRLVRFGIGGDSFVSIVGSQDYLRAQCGLDHSSLANRIAQQLVR